MACTRCRVIARLFHLLMLGLLIALAVTFGLGKLAVVGVIAVAIQRFVGGTPPPPPQNELSQ